MKAFLLLGNFLLSVITWSTCESVIACESVMTWQTCESVMTWSTRESVITCESVMIWQTCEALVLSKRNCSLIKYRNSIRLLVGC